MDLWKPDRDVRSKLSSGERKVRLGNLRSVLDSAVCSYCGKLVFLNRENGRYFTTGGSDHHCKGME